MIKITYHGHSCFTLENKGYSIVLDPYDAVDGYGSLSLTANEVYCSHEHFDHNYKACVKSAEPAENPFKISCIESFHDDAEGALRGPNTIRIFEAEGCRIAHFGDIGCELTNEQKEMLKELDVAMIPVGGTFTITAAQAKVLADELDPRIVIPMHFRRAAQGFEVLQDISDFTKLFSDSKREVLDAGTSVLVSHGTEGQQTEGTDKVLVMASDN